MRSASTSMANLVRIMCAIALLCVGLAHKPSILLAATTSLPVDELAQQYVLPDGTLPILCLPVEDEKSKHQDHRFGTGCEACRLSASIILPLPVVEADAPVFDTIAAHLPSRVEAHYRQIFPPSAFPRGPPPANLQA